MRATRRSTRSSVSNGPVRIDLRRRCCNPMHSKALGRVAAVAAMTPLTLASLAACGEDDAATVETSSPTAPSTLTSTSSSTSTMPVTSAATAPSTTPSTTDAPAPAHATERVWFLRDERLAATSRNGSTIEGLIRELFAGPRQGDDPRLVTLIPTGTALRSAVIDGQTLLVDVTGDFATGGGSLSMVGRLAELVWTATELEGIDDVRLLVDGIAIDWLGGEGIDVSRPLGRDDFVDFKPFVMVTSPRPGELVASPLVVSGENSTFENTVELTLTASDGTILVSSFATGTGPIMDGSGNPVWGPFATTIEFDAGSATVGVLTASERSAEDGSERSRVDVPVRFASSSTPTSTPSTPRSVSTPIVPAAEDAIAHLDAVRFGAHDGFDRVVFEFVDRVPGYSVGYVERPVIEDPSGREIVIEGDHVVGIRMEAASGFDQGTDPIVVTYSGPERLSPRSVVVRELARTGDFEAVLTWAIGVDAIVPFTVRSLDGPPRLVVDFATA
jgi:hypothetical protein